MYSQKIHDYRSERFEWGPTDLFYASPDYDFIPNYKVGRLPVNNNEEALAVVEKIERWYEHADQEWFRNIHIQTGKASIESAYVTKAYRMNTLFFNSDLMRNLFDGMQVSRCLSGEGSFQYKRLQSILKNGHVGFVIFFGHGYVDALVAGGEIFKATELMEYQRVDKTPIVLAIACNSGEWARDNLKRRAGAEINQDPHQPGFGEAILKSKAGGIAYFGPQSLGSGPTYFYYDRGKVIPFKHAYTGSIIYHTLRSYHEGADTLGKLISDGIFGFVSENEMDYWKNRFILLQSAYLGDPALKIPVKGGKAHKAGTKPRRMGLQPSAKGETQFRSRSLMADG